MRKATKADIEELARIATAAAKDPHFTRAQQDAWGKVMAGMPWSTLVEQGIWVVPGGFACRLGDLVHLCYVDPEVQGTGIGRRLMAHLEKEARTSGLARLRLHTASNARGFYERLGYRVVGEESVTLGGAAFQRWCMEKDLLGL